MSDHDEPAESAAFDEAALDDPAFEDPAYDDLRALLAETRVTEPVPADVAARLDATLGALREERRAQAARGSTVVPLRRRVGRILVAAAAVVAVGSAGVGIVQSARNGSSSSDSAAGGVAADQAGSDAVTPSAPEKAPAPSTTSLKSLQGAPQLTSAHFTRDVVRSMRSLTLAEGYAANDLDAPGTGTTGSAPLSGSLDSRGPWTRDQAPPVTATPGTAEAEGAKSGLAGCAGPDAPGSVTLSATLDGSPVALVFHPPTADAQVVEAWSCDGTTLLASAIVRH